MKNREKIIGIVLIVILLLILMLTGRTESKEEKTIKKAYESSKITEKMKGYILDLRIYGSSKDIKYNKIIRVNNYKNKEFSIYSYDNGVENNYAIKDGSTYKKIDDKYETSKITNYTKPDSYLNGLGGIKSAKAKKDETIGKETYKVYEVSFNKKSVNEMLKDTDIKLTVTKDIKGEVWTNKDGKIYKIYYYIDKLIVYASYFGYNTTSSINTK